MPTQSNIADDWGKLTPDQRKAVVQKLNPEQKQKLATSLGFNGGQQDALPKVSAQPSPFSVAGIKSKFYDLRNKTIDALPAIGGTAGGIAGTLAGAETGPGAVGTAMLGAGAGGVLGEDARQALQEHYGIAPRMNATQATMNLAGQGALQAGNELVGQGVGAVVGRGANLAGRILPEDIFAKYPILRSVFAQGPHQAEQRLTAAAANKGTENAGVALESISRSIGDIEQELKQLPKQEQTVDGFLKAVNKRKDAMNAESGAAMLPIAGQQVMPQGVSQRILGLIKPYMHQTAEGRAEEAYIRQRATEFQHPWNYRELDTYRTDISGYLSRHHAKEQVARYTAEKGNINLAIDTAIEDGLRDTVYPAMDRAAGKPSGYFEDLKGRQRALITLQSILNKRVKELKGSQAVAEVEPAISGSIYMHPGSLPRVYLHKLSNLVAPERVYNEASGHVRKAFKPTVDTLPYRVLFSAGVRAGEEYESQPAPRKHPTDAYAGQ